MLLFRKILMDYHLWDMLLWGFPVLDAKGTFTLGIELGPVMENSHWFIVGLHLIIQLLHDALYMFHLVHMHMLDNKKWSCLNIRRFSLFWSLLTEFDDFHLIFGQIITFHYSEFIFYCKIGFSALKNPFSTPIVQYLRF